MVRVDLTWEENPQPDERSSEEQALAEAVWKIFDATVITIVVGGEPPGTPNRRVAVAVACRFWLRWRFWKRHAQMVEAVKALVEPDAQVAVLCV
jgi:hypothetical protein